MVRFSRVALAYPDPRGRPGPEVLRDLSFTLGDGSFTWILGASGAGKTSVLGAQIARKDINTTFAEGWFNINTVTAATPNGLPIVGYAAAKSTGINLGGTWMHRTSR